MKLQQLRYVVEIVRHGNHLSAAADALNTSQPGVSRQIQLLELELGFEVFQRTRNRIIGITEPGQHVLAIAQRVTTDIAALRTLKSDMNSGNRGTLTIGTTHTQARYVLPSVVESFIKRYPHVQLVLKQGDPEEICGAVESGEADFAVGTETMRAFPGLVQLDCFSLPRSIIALKGHPLLEIDKLTVEAIAQYPIITYDSRYSGRWKVMKVFNDHGIKPKVSLSGIDADVCKTYVEKGLGVAILTTVTYDPQRDVNLAARDASHVFPSSMIKVSLRPNVYLRPFLVDFISSIAPQLTLKVLRDALREAPSRAGMY
jgi:LysR family transcriptional regulator, cys regulon transcriptional activator